MGEGMRSGALMALIAALVMFSPPTRGEVTIDKLKQTLGRLSIVHSAAMQSGKVSDADTAVILVDALMRDLTTLKGELRDGLLAKPAKNEAVRGTLSAMEVSTTSKPDKCHGTTALGDWLKVHFVGKT